MYEDYKTAPTWPCRYERKYSNSVLVIFAVQVIIYDSWYRLHDDKDYTK